MHSLVLTTLQGKRTRRQRTGELDLLVVALVAASTNARRRRALRDGVVELVAQMGDEATSALRMLIGE